MRIVRFMMLIFCACGATPSVVGAVAKTEVSSVEGAVWPRQTVVNTDAKALVFSINQLLLLSSDIRTLTGGAVAPYALGPDLPGAVKLLERRGSGAWVLAANGLFYDDGAKLLKSPLSTSIDVSVFSNVSSAGSQAAEELWLFNSSQAIFVQGAMSTPVTLNESGTAQPIEALVALGNKTAAAISKGQVLLLNVSQQSAKILATGATTVSATAQSTDAAWFATDTGLLSVGRDETTLLYAFQGAPIQALAANEAGIFCVVQNKLLRKTSTGFESVGSIAAPKLKGLSMTPGGLVYALDGNSVVKIGAAVASAPSFASDVKPFMNAHCMTCHRSMTPVRAFDTLAVASQYAAEIASRLQGVGSKNPMPPPAVEVLTRAQYDVVLRWVNEGKLP
jgi:mono/diheme cytochrome c family protein